MFETKKTLIVVYKDELLMNQLKKLVDTNDDDEQGIVGTRDDSINIVSWQEKVWLDNKKGGNIGGKILFLGDIKGTGKLIPVIDIKFDEYGVRFGWAGDQAVVYADPKALTSRKDYDIFLEKLSALHVPSILKATRKNTTEAGTDHESETEAKSPIEDAPDNDGADDKNHKRAGIIKEVKQVFSVGADTIGKAGTQVATRSEEIFRNRTLMKRQMLFYGVISFYNDGLEEFMNE